MRRFWRVFGCKGLSVHELWAVKTRWLGVGFRGQGLIMDGLKLIGRGLKTAGDESELYIGREEWRGGGE